MKNLLLAVLLTKASLAGVPSNQVMIRNAGASNINQPYRISRVFAKGEIAHFPAPVGIGEWQSVVKTRWPDGSVQHALISFFKSVGASSSQAVVFADSINPCYLGNQPTCDAAALSAAGMLAFNGGNWGLGFSAAATGGTTASRDIKNMISNGDFSYWVKGPVETTIIAEDRTAARRYDFGWNVAAQARITPSGYDVLGNTFSGPAGIGEGDPITPLFNSTTYSGTVTADGGTQVVTRVSGSNFNTSWGAGQLIRIADPLTAHDQNFTIARVIDASHLTVVEAIPTIATAVYYSASDGPMALCSDAALSSASQYPCNALDTRVAHVTVNGDTKTVTATSGSFDVNWPAGSKVRIADVWYTVASVSSATSLMVNEAIPTISTPAWFTTQYWATPIDTFYTGPGVTMQVHVVSSGVYQFLYQGFPLDIVSTGTVSPGFNSIYRSTIWTDDTASRGKSLHPILIATFFSGWAGVYGEILMQNGWTTAIQDQSYTLNVLEGASLGTIVKTQYVPHVARTSWVYRYWSGSATDGVFLQTANLFGTVTPPHITIDYNLPYLEYSKVFPQYDLSRNLDKNYIETEEYTNGGLGGGYVHAGAYQPNTGFGFEPFWVRPGTYQWGTWRTNIADYGGRPDIGLNPRQYVRYLYPTGAASPLIYTILIGDADLAVNIPYQMWESDTTKTWMDLGQTIPAFGRPLSINARPTFRIGWYPDNGRMNTATADLAQPLNSLTYQATMGWIPEYSQTSCAHQPNWYFVPYLLTGDYVYLTTAEAVNAIYLSRQSWNNRGKDLGITTYNDEQVRGVWWGIRSLADTLFMTPDGMPEKTFLQEKLDANLAYLEAFTGTTDGYYVTACNANTSRVANERNGYCYGQVMSNYMSRPVGGGNPLGIVFGGGQGPYDGATAQSDVYWTQFLASMVSAHVAELGFKTDRILRHINQWIVSNALDRAGSIPDLGNDIDYVKPTVMASDTSAKLTSFLTATGLSFTVSSTPALVNGFGGQPFMIAINGNEFIRICGVAGTTWTVCTVGRSGLSEVFGSWAPSFGLAHNPGEVITVYGRFFSSVAQFESLLHVHSTVVDTQNDAEFGYVHLYAAALAGTGNAGQIINGWDGKAAWDAVDATRQECYTHNWCYNDPKNSVWPRRDPVKDVHVQAGDTFANILYTAPSADSVCTVAGVADGMAGSRQRSFLKTGLAAASTGLTLAIHCSDDPYGSTTATFDTLPVLSGPGVLSVVVGGGSTDVWLDYGSDATVAQTVTAECSGGCTLTTPVTRGLVYYRIRRDTGAAPVQSVVVQ